MIDVAIYCQGNICASVSIYCQGNIGAKESGWMVLLFIVKGTFVPRKVGG